MTVHATKRTPRRSRVNGILYTEANTPSREVRRGGRRGVSKSNIEVDGDDQETSDPGEAEDDDDMVADFAVVMRRLQSHSRTIQISVLGAVAQLTFIPWKQSGSSRSCAGLSQHRIAHNKLRSWSCRIKSSPFGVRRCRLSPTSIKMRKSRRSEKARVLSWNSCAIKGAEGHAKAAQLAAAIAN